MSTTTKPRLSLRWFQFRLRTLLVAMLVFGCGLGWWAQKYRAAREAWEPILAIEESVQLPIDFEFENNVRSEGSWIERTLQIEMPNKVVGIQAPYNLNMPEAAFTENLKSFSDLRRLYFLGHAAPTDGQQFLSAIKNNPQLEKLELIATNGLRGDGWENLYLPRVQVLKLSLFVALPDEAMVRLSQSQTLMHLRLSHSRRDLAWSDKGILAIGSMQNLETLDLSPASLTKEQWQSLQNLGSLKTIHLNGFEMADDDLQHLPKWPKLEELDLSSSMITDDGLNHLIVFQKLKSLDLEFTDISDQGVSHLLQFHALEKLKLGVTKITDDGVKQLTAAKSLIELELHNLPITDAGLEHIAKMTNLKRVTLSDTNVSEGAMQKIKNARPDLEIDWFLLRY